MRTTFFRTALIVTSCALLATTGCKKQSDADKDTTAQVELPSSGVAFREGFMEQTLSGMAQGVTPASELHEDCEGFIGEAPTREISFVEDVPMRIHITAVDDLVLVLQHGEDVYCNDDFDGHQPSIARTWEKGSYAVYIGTKEKTDAAVLYELNFDHYDPRHPLEPSTPPDEAVDTADTEEKPSEVPYEPVFLENPSKEIRLPSGTLSFDNAATPVFDSHPFVPNGIAQHPFALEEDALAARTTVVDETACPVLVDTAAPDYFINMLAQGDLHIGTAAQPPVALVLSSRSDRVFCALPGDTNQSTLRFENLPEGTYALRIAPLMATEAAAEDAPPNDVVEPDKTADETADETADKDAAVEIKGKLHFY